MYLSTGCSYQQHILWTASSATCGLFAYRKHEVSFTSRHAIPKFYVFIIRTRSSLFRRKSIKIFISFVPCNCSICVWFVGYDASAMTTVDDDNDVANPVCQCVRGGTCPSQQCWEIKGKSIESEMRVCWAWMWLLLWAVCRYFVLNANSDANGSMCSVHGRSLLIGIADFYVWFLDLFAYTAYISGCGGCARFMRSWTLRKTFFAKWLLLNTKCV